MPRVGIEPTIPVFERAKTVHASGRTATVIGGSTSISLLLFTSALDGGEWSASRSFCFIPEERAPSNHCIGGWVNL
jgi:hypothetical protein